MSRFSSLLPRFIIAAVLVVGLAFLLFRKSPPAPQTPVLLEPAPPLALSDLAPPPDWSTLQAYQGTMTRAEFEQLMTGVFTTGNGWRSVILLNDAEARIQTGSAPDSPIFHLRFAQPGQEVTAPRTWRTAAELSPPPLDKPLAGLRVAIDPGHIGGVWAKMEERWLALGTDPPICEGDMTLQVAQLLKPQLEALGATVSLVRENSQPVTRARPDTLLAAAEESLPTSSETTKQRAERLFYRTAEIHARAQRVNEILRPDLVLCLHFNAAAWGDPTQPTLTDHHHLHLLLNGAYSDAEVLLADQRHALLSKLLQRTHAEEVAVGAHVAEIFAKTSSLPPYSYMPESKNALPVPGQPYLWIRNLLANRLYHCPVIYLEPYVMNSSLDYPRFQAGDYDGLHEISGKMQPSVFREYATAVAQGLANYYRR